MYRVFLSSPDDVRPERQAAQAVVDRINAERPAEPLLSLTRWEQSYYLATGTFQDQISSAGEHDLVVFIFWKRFGTDLPPAYNRADGTSRSGTEYEFEDARDARERRADHLPDIIVYRKTAKVLFSEENLESERAQKKSLDQFWERWFRSDTGHFVAGFQSFPDAADFERQFERNLRDWLGRRHAGTVVWNVDKQGSPYRGLAPYEEGHAGLFFGRDADVGRARALFIEAGIGQESGRRGTPFLLILGATGSGKSSFLRAGLLPRMRSSGVPAFLEDGSDAIYAFRTLTLMPRELGENLCAGFAAALYREVTSGTRDDVGLPQLALGDYPTPEAFATLAGRLPESACAPLLRALDRVAPAGAADAAGSAPRRYGLLLAIDQMEELFARPDDDRRAFVQLLSALLGTGRVWVTGTMRNDFYDRLRQDAELSQLANRGRLYDLLPPTLADYRDIIRQPAKSAGLHFEATEHRDLAVEIEAEAGSDGALPMIAFLLEQLFQERAGNLLRLDTYDRLGGAAGALAERGDQMFAGLPANVQDAFPRVVRRLVRKSVHDLAPTATAAPLDAFPVTSADHELIEALSEARLVRKFSVLGGPHVSTSWVRWTHEALLTRWPRLRNSVDAERRDYETLDRLQTAHSLWQGTPEAQQEGRLLTDLALAEAADLVRRWGRDVDASLRALVEQSLAHAQLRRRRRRRLTTAIVASLALLLILATAAGVVAWTQRNLALRQQMAADRTSQFMISLFRLADPSENRGNSVTVREVLDRGARSVGEGLKREPAIRADLLTAMGQAYSGLGLYAPAGALLKDALADQAASTVTAQSRVRTLDAAGANLYLAGEYEPAHQQLEQAAELARRTLKPTDLLRSQTIDDLADVQSQLGNDAEAIKLAQEALQTDRQRGPEQADMLARTLDTLGNVNFYAGDLPAAEKAMREALALHQRVSGTRDALTAQAMNNLAAVLYQMGRYDENIALMRGVLPIYREVYGTEHPEVATVLGNLGRSTLMAGHVDDAIPYLQQSLAMNEKLKGKTHSDLVSPLNSLAMIDAYQGHGAQASAEIRRAEDIARLPNHGGLLDQVLLNEADMAVQSGDVAAAATALAESRRLLEAQFPLATHPEESWRHALWDSVDAEVLSKHGDAQAAQAKITAALPVIAARFGPGGFHTLLANRRAQWIKGASAAH